MNQTEVLPTWEEVIATAWYADDPQTILALVALAAEMRAGGQGPTPGATPMHWRTDEPDALTGDGVTLGYVWPGTDGFWCWRADGPAHNAATEADARAALVAHWTARGYQLVSA